MGGSDRLMARVSDFGFNNMKDNIIDLQIADLIAFSVTIHLLYPERNNPSYEAVKSQYILRQWSAVGLKVIFMADASTSDTDVTRPLTQGYGAIVWATEVWQADRHPCYVLVPQYSGVTVNDAYVQPTMSTW